jgi:hypothetical protein
MNLSSAARSRSHEEQGGRTQSAGIPRRGALLGLYQRRAAVDQLISALERYQRDQNIKAADGRQFSVFGK